MPAFELKLTDTAVSQLNALERTNFTKAKKVRRCLAKLQAQGPRYPGLQSHQYRGSTGPAGEPVWESYVENNTPGAWRVWWYYGPRRGEIIILLIAEHPD